jgi:nitric oxide reductase subunit B
MDARTPPGPPARPQVNWWARLVINRRNWWLPLTLIAAVGLGSMLFVGARTYRDAPPVPDFVAADGSVVVAAEAITRGQVVFQRYALMDHGSMFGDGAARGPDYTADALHALAVAMRARYLALYAPSLPREAAEAAATARMQQDLKTNRFDAAGNDVLLTEAQLAGYAALQKRYLAMFRGEGPEAFSPAEYISDAGEVNDLTAFFFWGAWVCAAARPGETYSYTHNWPYDELAGNRPSSAIVYWSVVAALGLVAVLGLVLYLYGRYSRLAGWQADKGRQPLGAAETDAYDPTATQRATFKFFALAAGLFVLQVLAGILTVHDFLGLTTWFGIDTTGVLPITVTRGWHLQLALLWISVCWFGASIFVLSPRGARSGPAQRRLVNVLFTVLVVLAVGSLAGVWAGPLGHLGSLWRLFGNQGWEFVELGKAWQVVMFAAFVLWTVIIARAVRPLWRSGDAWILPKWLLYAVASITVLFLSAFVAGPKTNFVVADFWRWAVVHMWAEAFFEVFTTVLLAYFMVMMGFVGQAAASRIVYLATLLFLGSGLLGISHNFYWNAKPVATLAIGSVFSTLQVVPLILLTLEAWQFRRLPRQAVDRAGSARGFGQEEAFLFLVGVNFWNFLGAGLFGFMINLPIVNYYEHSTYLTVNHGHAALMGVYGNLALAAIVFCSRFLLEPQAWDARLLRRVFWSINVGLALMIVVDLLPVGSAQFAHVLDHGLWSARSQAFVQGGLFQTLTWARIVGGALFVLGGVLPLAWFMLSRLAYVKRRRARAPRLGHAPAAAD